MKLRVLAFLSVISIATTVYGQEDGQGRSIMFQDSQDQRSELTTLPDSQHEDRGERCMQMLNEAEQLKGKPQRRAVAMERYRQECEMR